jgi:FkbM family methyltransferase
LPGVGDFRIAVGREEEAGTASFGRDPISEAIARTGALPSQDLVLLMLALTRPGHLVVDLGAHVGQFTLSAAAAGRRVLAIEASRRNQALLRAGIEANHFTETVELVHAAASNQPGELRFHEAGPYGGVLGQGHPAGTVVPAVRVGDLLKQKPGPIGLIKIDVEGYEIEALEGLAGWLSDCGDDPPILYESHQLGHEARGRSPLAVRALLGRLGYAHHYLVSPPRLLPLGEADPQPMLVGDCLAIRKPLAPPAGWRVGRPLSASDFISLFLDDVEAHRHYPLGLASLGRSLQACPGRLLQHPRVRLYLGEMAHHPDAEVRAAFAPWAGASAGPWARERLGRQSGRLLRGLVRVLRRLGEWSKAG